MFEALAIIGSILSFVGSQQRASAQEKAAARQEEAALESRRIADRNAARIEAETAETVRREKLDAERRRGYALAAAAASGGEVSGSQELYLQEMEQNDESYLAWLEKSGASRADITRRQGGYDFLTGMAAAGATSAQADASRWEGYGSLISGAQSGWEWYQGL